MADERIRRRLAELVENPNAQGHTNPVLQYNTGNDNRNAVDPPRFGSGAPESFMGDPAPVRADAMQYQRREDPRNVNPVSDYFGAMSGGGVAQGIRGAKALGGGAIGMAPFVGNMLDRAGVPLGAHDGMADGYGSDAVRHGVNSAIHAGTAAATGAAVLPMAAYPADYPFMSVMAGMGVNNVGLALDEYGKRQQALKNYNMWDNSGLPDAPTGANRVGQK